MRPHETLRLAIGQKMLAVGRRVRILNPYGRPMFGTYLGQVRMREIFHHCGPVTANYTTPKIKFDSGKVIYGFSCWWDTKLFSFSPD